MADREEVLSYIREEASRPVTLEEVAGALGIPGKGHGRLAALLGKLEEAGEIVRTRTGRYGPPERMNLVVGRLQGNPRGYAFLVPDRPGQPHVYISATHINGAMHGDRVVARLLARARPGQRAEGEIVRVLERANRRVVGTLEKGRHYHLVVPDERRLTPSIMVPRKGLGRARDGEKVVVEITAWPQHRRPPEGRVIERLGMPEDPGVDVEAIIRSFGLPGEFPGKALREAETLPDRVLEEELEGREDLRGLPVVTIDGEDAKDLDDAVSLEKVDGRWRLGVHIADVAYYVREGSALDREAAHRGCSIYLVDRVIPMLPPRLSNGICSLNPRVDRLTLSVFMDFDPGGKPLNYRIAPSVIRTRERMTYSVVNRLLKGEGGELRERYADLLPYFRWMEELCLILRGRRMRQGSLDFEFPEEKVVVDEGGRPVEIKRLERTIADQIIEEFMLACNRTVAEHFFRAEVPFLYRVHEEPEEEKMIYLKELLGSLGLGLRWRAGSKIHPRDLQGVLRQAEGRREERLVNMVVLRSLKQARYSATNLAHFGLGFKYYTHFTSPIRRYPDLVVHRIVRATLGGGMRAGGGLPARMEARLRRSLPGVAGHSSERERLAQEAERETVNLKKAQYMRERLGEVYDGFIAGVTPYGLYVELDNTVEGLLHVSNLTDDFYYFDEKRYALVGERTRRLYRLGDPIRVQVARVNVEERLIDFLPAS